MSLDEIRAWRNAKPFRPFQIETREGKKIFVGSRERIGFAPNGQLIAVFEGSRPHTLPLAQVADVKLFVRPARRGG